MTVSASALNTDESLYHNTATYKPEFLADVYIISCFFLLPHTKLVMKDINIYINNYVMLEPEHPRTMFF